MQTEVARAGAEMRPRRRTTDQRRRGVKNEEKADADSNQEKTEFTIFRQERESHGATLNK